jgi:hypothetical protein
MYTFCCLIWKRDFAASYTCFVVEMASLVLARRRRKIFERTLHFLLSRRRKQFFFFGGGSKWCHIYTFFTQPAADENCFFLGQNGAIYTRFLHSQSQAEKIGVFWGQNGAIYTHFGFFYWGIKMVPYIHIWGVFLVKMLPYVHILGGFWVKMLPYIHISGIYFLPKKRKKKNNTRRGERRWKTDPSVNHPKQFEGGHLVSKYGKEIFIQYSNQIFMY